VAACIKRTSKTRERVPSCALVSNVRIAAMLVLGFASGIAYQFFYITQSSWVYEAKVPIGIIGTMSELTLAYKFKFV
jgi:PAT family beta-lactamase induction signal transducer AmpG